LLRSVDHLVRLHRQDGAVDVLLFEEVLHVELDVHDEGRRHGNILIRVIRRMFFAGLSELVTDVLLVFERDMDRLDLGDIRLPHDALAAV